MSVRLPSSKTVEESSPARRCRRILAARALTPLRARRNKYAAYVTNILHSLLTTAVRGCSYSLPKELALCLTSWHVQITCYSMQMCNIWVSSKRGSPIPLLPLFGKLIAVSLGIGRPANGHLIIAVKLYVKRVALLMGYETMNPAGL